MQSPVLGNNLVLNFDTAVKDQDLMLSMKMIFMLPTVISLIRQVSSQFLSQVVNTIFGMSFKRMIFKFKSFNSSIFHKCI
jgi:hypothetical protein